MPVPVREATSDAAVSAKEEVPSVAANLPSADVGVVASLPPPAEPLAAVSADPVPISASDVFAALPSPEDAAIGTDDRPEEKAQECKRFLSEVLQLHQDAMWILDSFDAGTMAIKLHMSGWIESIHRQFGASLKTYQSLPLKERIEDLRSPGELKSLVTDPEGPMKVKRSLAAEKHFRLPSHILPKAFLLLRAQGSRLAPDAFPCRSPDAPE